MYNPASFREDRIEVMHRLIRDHPLGLLVTAGPGGLAANPIPFLIEPDGPAAGTLRAHLARANPQVDDLAQARECLVVFQGPQGYVSPSWYATKRETGRVVPTWNYATVHAWGRPAVVEDAGWLRRQLGALTLRHEADRPLPWRLEDAPEEFLAAQMRGIVGLEIPIGRIEGKWKVSQNRSAADREGVAEGFRLQGEPGRAMADLVARGGAGDGPRVRD